MIEGEHHAYPAKYPPESWQAAETRWMELVCLSDDVLDSTYYIPLIIKSPMNFHQ